MNEDRVRGIEGRIAELKGRWPAHSVPPHMWQEIEALEEELAAAKQEASVYGYKRKVTLSYEDAVQKVRDELKKEGFGVLTEIDVKETLKKKLNIDFERYIILGACNPPFAYAALQAERDIGLLMPCNLIVYEKEAQTFVAATRPTVTMATVKNPGLEGVAGEVESKLRKVVDGV